MGLSVERLVADDHARIVDPFSPEGERKQPSDLSLYVFSAMVGTARCAVPARVVTGGMNIRGTMALEGVAPLHAARTSQRDVPTTLNRYPLGGERAG